MATSRNLPPAGQESGAQLAGASRDAIPGNSATPAVPPVKGTAKTASKPASKPAPKPASKSASKPTSATKSSAKAGPGKPGSVASTPAPPGQAEGVGAGAAGDKVGVAKPTGERLSDEERQRRIAEAAYRKAQERGFDGDRHVEDWLEAEREHDASTGRAMGPDGIR